MRLQYFHIVQSPSSSYSTSSSSISFSSSDDDDVDEVFLLRTRFLFGPDVVVVVAVVLSLLDGDIGCCGALVEGDFVLGGGALFSLNTHSIRQPIYRFKPLGKGSESSIFVVVFL